jgi:hypothetical protein
MQEKRFMGSGHRILISGWALALALFLSGTASAASLFGGLVPPPDLASTNTQVVYDATTDIFTASGVPGQFNDGSDLWLIFPASSIDLTATIDGAGNLISGALSITGSIPGLSLAGPDLLLGTLTAVGDIGTDLQFLVTITGGDLQGYYPSQAGIVIGGAGFTGWDANFSNGGAGTVDVAPIPEPGTAALLALGLVFVGAGRSARRRD